MHKTTKGIVLDITHEQYGMLEQGGWSDRRVLIYYASIGMPRDAKLDDVINEYGTTWHDMAWEYARETNWAGDKVLRKGHIIQ